MSPVNAQPRKQDCLNGTDRISRHHNNADSGTRQELIIQGAACTSRVGTFQSALRVAPGVENADMSFVQCTVSVTDKAAASR